MEGDSESAATSPATGSAGRIEDKQEGSATGHIPKGVGLNSFRNKKVENR